MVDDVTSMRGSRHNSLLTSLPQAIKHFRYSLRSVFLVIAIVAGVLVIIIRPMWIGRSDRFITQSFIRDGAYAEREGTLTGLPEWIERILPADYHVRTTGLQWRGNPSAAQFRTIAQLSHLRKIQATECDVKESDFAAIGQLGQLRELRLQNGNIETRGLRYLLHCTHLEIIDFKMSTLGSGDAGVLSQLPKLHELDLRCPVVGFASLCIGESETLDRLGLPKCNSVELRDLPKLSRIDATMGSIGRFVGTNIGKAKCLRLNCDYVELSGFPNLTCLKVVGTKRIVAERLPSLESLVIDPSMEWSSAGFVESLNAFPRLRSVSVTYGLSERDLEGMKRLPRLEELDLGSSQVAMESLAKLKGFPRPLLVATSNGESDVIDLDDTVTVVIGSTLGIPDCDCGSMR